VDAVVVGDKYEGLVLHILDFIRCISLNYLQR